MMGLMSKELTAESWAWRVQRGLVFEGSVGAARASW